jgi:hypothetical protein
MECMKEDADCESYGRYEYWSAEGDCEDEQEDYLDCLSDESDVIGGSGEGEVTDEIEEAYEEADESVEDETADGSAR